MPAPAHVLPRSLSLRYAPSYAAEGFGRDADVACNMTQRNPLKQIRAFVEQTAIALLRSSSGVQRQTVAGCSQLSFDSQPAQAL